MEILVEVTRKPLVESIHRGSIAVTDAVGNLIAWAGDPESTTYYRSAAKPIQALPVITSGAADKFGLTDAELAIICSSHSGEDDHVKVITGLLDKLGFSMDMLQCGTHPPFNNTSALEIWRKGLQPTALHCNCSGKHLGMLAICKAWGWSTDDYLKLDHPLQQLLLTKMKEYHNYDKIVVGVDGCGVPVYGLPLKEMAKGFARLSKPDNLLPAEISDATKRLVTAMTNYPKLVAGTSRLDTILMEILGHTVVSKAGAEGVQCLGLLEQGIGIAIKIEDGAIRATAPTCIEVLRQLGVLSEKELQQLNSRHYAPIKNQRNEIVGELRPVFKLNHIQKREPT
ncbi:MAG: asparaginase [Desulfitobacteriaceae bacterium]